MAVPWMKACGKALTKRERERLRALASLIAGSFKRPVIVNIGVFRCASMYCLRAGAPKARLVGVDIKPCSVPIHSDLRAEFIIGDSRTCYKDFKEAIHLLFIDGDHHYETVKADIKNWASKVAPGGIVAFHDYAPLAKDIKKIPHLRGVRKAIDEWAVAAKADWIRMEAPNSLGIFQRRK